MTFDIATYIAENVLQKASKLKKINSFYFFQAFLHYKKQYLPGTKFLQPIKRVTDIL